MARTLNEFLVSTGNYTYEITDAAMAGVEINDLEIAVALHCNLENGSEFDVIVCSRKDIESLFDIVGSHIFNSPSYCRNVGDGMFITSIPFWRIQRFAEEKGTNVISAEFEVVLFGFNTLEHSTGNNTGKASFQCIVIDTGTIEFTKNRFPLPLSSENEEGTIPIPKPLSVAKKKIL